MLFLWQLQISQAIPNQMYSPFFAPKKKYSMDFEILENSVTCLCKSEVSIWMEFTYTKVPGQYY